MEENMLKHLSICTAMVLLGTASALAQQAQSNVETVDVPGGEFEVVVVTSAIPMKPATDRLGNHVVYLLDGEVATMQSGRPVQEFKAIDYRHFPACSLEVQDLRNGEPGAHTVSIHVVPKATAALVSGLSR
jgi:hypothetical protein